MSSKSGKKEMSVESKGFSHRLACHSTMILVILVSVFFKMLLIPAYHSTDFEVHRNWLAITHSLPVSKWYYENTSEWTLDYPPFFAYFEYTLSIPARFIDSGMLKVENLNYKSPETINYQRLTVIFTEFLLVFATILIIKKMAMNNISSHQKERFSSRIDILDKYTYLLVQFVFSFGLIIVDNIHFQYNGFLFGLMFLSIYFIQTDRWLIGSFLFSSLINFKHIYLYIAPAYFFYIFIYYCLKPPGLVSKFLRLVSIGVVAVLPFVLSFGPFLLKGQLEQLLSRLFPFKRGLSHAYWAPNAWSLYNFVDKVLSFVLKRASPTGNSATSGLVQDIEHLTLPSISPFITFVLSFVFMLLPILVLVFRDLRAASSKSTSAESIKNQRILILLITICAFSSFMFGWHVHEKAILLIILPLSLISLTDPSYAKLYYFLSVIANYSLFPLLFTNPEYPIKNLLLAVTSLYNYCSLKNQFKEKFSFNILEVIFLSLIIPLEFYNNILHFWLGMNLKFAYLPLMFTSVYCAVGVTYSWLKFLVKITFKSY